MAKFIVTHGIRIATEFTPQTFGRLTTVGPAFRMCNQKRQVCECVCGEIVLGYTGHLLSGKVFSCGCQAKENNKKANTKHGRSGSPEFKVWCSMHTRCYNPDDKSYTNYGGRGIGICDVWNQDKQPKGLAFKQFYADMGDRPSPKHTIERLRVNEDYGPDNCIWADKKIQANNTRANVRITYQGRTQTRSQWADEVGIASSTIRARLLLGWTIEQALTIPAVVGRNQSGLPKN